MTINSTKDCPKCGKNKDTSYFYKNATSRDGLGVYCKECSKIHNKVMYTKFKDKRQLKSREAYYANKTSIKETRKKYNLTDARRKVLDRANKKIADVKQKAVDYKGGKCSVCGYGNIARSLCFHHLDPKIKVDTVTNIIRSRKSTWEMVKVELDKCILLCHNCHMEVHDKENNEYNYKNILVPDISEESRLW